MKKLEIKKGQQFGRLTIINESENIGNRRAFKCKCDCGTIKDIRLGNLIQGTTISCGCYNIELSIKMASERTTYGMRSTRIYSIWCKIKNRCNNSNTIQYKDWGGRGIKVEWSSFEEFYEDMKEGYEEHLTIDRRDNDGNYSKNNCRWATMKQQARNKRNNVLYKDKCIAEWAEELGVNKKTIYDRISRGWSIEKAIFS